MYLTGSLERRLLITATLGILLLANRTQACHVPTNAGLRPNALGPQYPQLQNGMMNYGNPQPNMPYNPYGQYG